MKVYIVQERHWQFNDDYYLLDDCYPIKAFESREDAEQFCQQKNKETPWSGNDSDWMLTENGAEYPQSMDWYEIVEAEVTV